MGVGFFFAFAIPLPVPTQVDNRSLQRPRSCIICAHAGTPSLNMDLRRLHEESSTIALGKIGLDAMPTEAATEATLP